MSFANPNGPAICYTFDRNYAPYAVVSMLSAQKHCATPIRFYCLIPHDQPECQAVFGQLQKRGFEIHFIPVDLSIFDGWMNLPRFGNATYLRLLIPLLIPEDVVLYLDPDTLVYRTIEPLLKTPLGDAMIAAKIDSNPLDHPVSKLIQDTYINTGVVLFNRKAFAPGYLDALKTLQWKHHSDLRMPDQCLLNLFANGRKVMLAAGWNRMFYMRGLKVAKWKADLANPAISIGHYATTPKPWCQWAHPEVAAHWWGFVKENGLVDIPMVPITKLEHMEHLATLHDINGEYHQASAVKGTIIDQLKSILQSRQAAG